MWAIHAVVINKVIPVLKDWLVPSELPLEEAIKISQEIIKNHNRKFMREETNTYRFRNISKQKFNKFKTKVINENINIVFGRLKSEFKNLQ